MHGKATATLICILCLLCSLAWAETINLKGVVTNTQKKPVGGAQVIALRDMPRYWHPQDAEPLATTTANASGEFTLRVPTTASLALVAWSPHHRMTKFGVSNPRAASQRTIGLALDDGYTLTGHVLDASTGTPVTGAQVGPLVASKDTETRRAQRVVPQWKTTGADGAFTLEGLAPDITHTLLVQAPGYGMANLELSPRQKTAEVRIGRGGFAVQGEVFAKNRAPQSFANTIVWANGNGFDVITRTDAHGHFHLDGLPGGAFSLQPLLPGDERALRVEVVELPRDHNTSRSLEVTSGFYVRGLAMDAETSTPAQRVAIKLNDQWTTTSADGAFVLGPYFQAMQFTPQVSEADGWQLDQVVGPDENMQSDGFTDMSGIVVEVRRQRLLDITLENFAQTTQPITISILPAHGGPSMRTVTTSTVQIPVFLASTYNIYATSGGMASPLETVAVQQETSLPVTLRMGKAADVRGRVVVHNAQETTRVQTLRLAMRVHFPNQGEAGPLLFQATAPRHDGSFLFPAMPTGTFVLSLANQSGTSETTQPVTLTPGDNELGEFNWDAGNRIAGRVLSAPDTPVPFARITLAVNDQRVIRMQTDANGFYRAEDLPAAQLALLMVEAHGFAIHREADIPLPADNKNILLSKLGTIKVTLDQPPASRWGVSLVRISPWATGVYANQLMGHSITERDINASELIEFPLEESGTFRVVALSRNDHKVIVSDLINWTGATGASEIIVLSDARKGTITGTASGNPGVEITAINTTLPETAGKSKTEFTAQTINGRFELTGLNPGNYLLLGQGGGYSAFALNVEVPAGQTVTANLEEAQTVTISGTVEVLGERLPQATVRLLSETDPNFPEQNTVTDAQGAFAFEDVLPDSYSVSVSYNTENGELNTRRSVAVKSGEPPAPLQVDLTPPRSVVLTVEASAGVAPGSEIFLMEKSTRKLIPAQWKDGALTANAPAGEYEVWLGDAPTKATATITEHGTGTVK